MRKRKSQKIFINIGAVTPFVGKNWKRNLLDFSHSAFTPQFSESLQDNSRFEQMEQAIDMEVKPQSEEVTPKEELRKRKDEEVMENQEQPCGCGQNGVFAAVPLRTLQVDHPFVPVAADPLPTPEPTVTVSNTVTVPPEVVTGVGGLPALTTAIARGLTLNFDVSNVKGIIQQVSTTITPPPPLPQDYSTTIMVDEVYLNGEIAYSLGFPVTYTNPCGTLSFNFYANDVVSVNNLICLTCQTTNPIPNVCLTTGAPSVQNIIPLSNGGVVVVLNAVFTLPACTP